MPSASAGVLPTLEDKVKRAEDFLLRSETWARARAEPGISMYNGRAKVSPLVSKQARAPNDTGATFYTDISFANSNITGVICTYRFRIMLN